MELKTSLERTNVLTRWEVAKASPATASDYETCRHIMRRASKNYSFASAFFPAEKRPHVEALYAFLRVGDDRVDVSHSGFASPLAAIEAWEHAYWRAFESGDSPEPVLRAYLNTAYIFDIPADVMDAYFRAMKADLVVTRFPTYADLVYYMDGSAVPVGRGMTYILGVRPPAGIGEALPGADSLSQAMQLSNFWRDIAYDWSIGRVYLPQEDMDRFGYTEADLAAGRVTSRLVDLLEYEFERTEGLYAHARQAIPLLANGQWAVMSGLEVYRAILDGIRRNRYNVFDRRAGTNKLQKVRLAARSLAWITLGL